MLVVFLRASDFILTESRKLASKTDSKLCDVISLSGIKKNKNKSSQLSNIDS